MLYTPVLVDRLRLPYPSGLAVANILRALTDPRLLRRSVGARRRRGGRPARRACGQRALRVAGRDRAVGLDLRRRLVVGARIGIPAVIGGLLGWALAAVLRLHRLAGARRSAAQDHVPDRAGHHHGRGHRRPGAGLRQACCRQRTARTGAAETRPTGAASTAAASCCGWSCGAPPPWPPATWCCSSRCCSCSSRSRWCSCSRWSTASRSA
jgi:hypothetical protein